MPKKTSIKPEVEPTPVLIESGPTIIDAGPGKRPKIKTVRPPRVKKKFNWNRFIEFNLDTTKEKIRFVITYMMVGLAFILTSDVFRLVHLKTTGGFMVFFGIMAIIGAIVVPIIKLIQENEDREAEKRQRQRENNRWPR